MILSFYRSKSHSFQHPKKTGFPGFLFSATQNPGFKILPRVGNTNQNRLKTMALYLILGFSGIKVIDKSSNLRFKILQKLKLDLPFSFCATPGLQL